MLRQEDVSLEMREKASQGPRAGPGARQHPYASQRSKTVGKGGPWELVKTLDKEELL